MASQLLGVLCITLALLTPTVVTDYATYLKVGDHARQMQSWKTSTRDYIATLKSLSDFLRVDTIGLNTTILAAKDQADTHVNVLELTADNMIGRLTELQNDITLLDTGYVAPPAFQAFMATGDDVPLAVSYISIKYGNVHLNDGNHYSAAEGLFTAPKNGLYWFHAVFAPTGSLKREAYIKKMPADGGPSENIAYLNYYNQQETATTTLVNLRVGDTVGIYPTVNNFESWGMNAGQKNTFAGYLVATDSFAPAAASAAPATAAPATAAPATPAVTAAATVATTTP